MAGTIVACRCQGREAAPVGAAQRQTLTPSKLSSGLQCLPLASVDGAIAGLACFSGLELDEICELRWSDRHLAG